MGFGGENRMVFFLTVQRGRGKTCDLYTAAQRITEERAKKSGRKQSKFLLARIKIRYGAIYALPTNPPISTSDDLGYALHRHFSRWLVIAIDERFGSKSDDACRCSICSTNDKCLGGIMIRSFGGRTITALAVLLLASLAVPSQVHAADLSDTNSGDTAWMIVATALVLFMTIPALALFYGGLVRTKNVLSVLMQCLVLTALMSVIWVAFGYTMAFDTTGMEKDVVNLHSFIGGFSKAMMKGVTPESVSGSIPEILFAAFQMTFAIITPALMIGAFAERMKFGAVLLFSTIWLIVVYLPICHMTWGGEGGLFYDWGVMDFAGGIVVHITAGLGALVACIMIGPRAGYPRHLAPPHNLTMTVTGTAMLWVGWYGFNAGSALEANGTAAMALMVTHISASVATLVWMGIDWLTLGKPSVLGAATGSIAGLAAITPASGFVGPLGAFAIGACSAAICYIFAIKIKNILKYDDSLDVFGVHGVGGLVGTILCGVFAASMFGGNQAGNAEYSIAGQVMTQTMAAVLTAIYTVIASFIILKIIDLAIGLRATVDVETEGLDLGEFEERGYIMN